MSWWRPSHVGYAVRSKLADIGQGVRTRQDEQGPTFILPFSILMNGLHP